MAARQLQRALSTAPAPSRRIFFSGPDGARLSPWHDIPLSRSAGSPALLNYVCEIPRGTRPKYEISTGLEGNPIVQDVTKDGKLRDYKLDSLTNCAFTRGGTRRSAPVTPHAYLPPPLPADGALPQTWENPLVPDGLTSLLGDGDPVDVCEIGGRLATTGEAYTVKVLGVLAMIDGGETDWKVLAIRADDPRAEGLRDITTAPASVVKQAEVSANSGGAGGRNRGPRPRDRDRHRPVSRCRRRRRRFHHEHPSLSSLQYIDRHGGGGAGGGPSAGHFQFPPPQLQPVQPGERRVHHGGVAVRDEPKPF